MIKKHYLLTNLVLGLLSFSFNAFGQCNNFVNHFSSLGDETVVDAKQYQGSFYVLGTFDNEINLGNDSYSTLGSEDVFVAKLDGNGNVVWAERLGGLLSDKATALEVDASGNVYITGEFKNTLTAGAFSVTSVGNEDVFIAKYSSTGSVLWLESDGTVNGESGLDVAVSANAVYYVTNLREIIKRDLNGSFLTSVSSNYDEFQAIAVNSNNDVYVSGRNNEDENTVFLSKKSGTDLSEISTISGIHSSYYGEGNYLEIDNQDNVYLAGTFEDQITFGSTTLNSVGDDDAFIVKFNSGGTLIYAQSAGSSSCCDNFENVSINPVNGHAYLGVNLNRSGLIGGLDIYDEIWVELDALGNVIEDQSISNVPLAYEGGFILVNSVTNDFMLIGEDYSLYFKDQYYSSNSEDVFVVGFNDFGYFKNLDAPVFCASIVDPSTGKNQLIWDSNQETGFESYRIYKRNLFTEFEEVVEQASGGSGVFIDMDSDPIKKAEYYQLTGVDACGEEYGVNSYVGRLNTSHLILYQGPNGVWSLSWSYYNNGDNDDNEYYYRILRGATEANMTPYDSVSNFIETWTDTDPLSGDAFYKIEIVYQDQCGLTQLNPSTNKVSVGDFNIGLADASNESRLEVFPNPTSGKVFLEEEMDYIVLDIYGKIVIESVGSDIDLSSVKNGMYVIKTTNGQSTVIKE